MTSRTTPTPVATDPAANSDQVNFELDADRFAAMKALLDEPPAPGDQLRRTMKAPLPWPTAPGEESGATEADRVPAGGVTPGSG